MAFASCTKLKFGVIFNENMDLKEIVDIWNNKVSQQVKDDNSALDTEIQAAAVTVITQEGVHALTVTSIDAYIDIAQLTEDAAALITGNITLPAVHIASNLAKGLDNAQIPILDSAQQSIITNMNC